MSKQIIFQKALFITVFLLLGLSLAFSSANAQNIDDLDALLIDRDIENYSIRVFTNFKVNKFSIKNEDFKARFVPNNRHGLGLGFANRKVIVDIGFNLKNPNKEETRRFDLQGTTILEDRHFANIYVQTYKGFTAKNNFDDPFVFRSDVRSVSFGFNYLFTLDDIEFSYALLKAGFSEERHKDIFITGGLGVFGGFDYFSAKPNILSESTNPYFNAQGNIKRYQGATVGVLAGFISYFKLPENISATINVMPGIGLVNKKITLEDDSYRPANPMLYKLDFSLGLGYNFNRFYVSFTYNNGLYSTDLDYDNTYNLNITNAKLAVGYRFKSKTK
ncbi:DUF4421 family protein [Winogradskyella forsetii]|uniref:DUF4421 family protein n=1 Tax=Winogradskyella forsetii TaxID=2686077 RepID=UPI00211803A4|nr:DUF4421 family protein [Winogradskyella forsetii]